tara:strand:+ start:14076 stop:14243 length:168 start_codon:yes stop_codon:yes gene_type:complete
MWSESSNKFCRCCPLATPVPPASRDAFLQRIAFIIEQMEQQTALAFNHSPVDNAR